MGSETNGPSSSSSQTAPAAASPASTTTTTTPVASPSTKRSRDPEDDVYVDNLHSHKRYLSEIMASSLNGLTVGDSIPENIMESPARSDSMFYPRDEMSFQYSPMSEDLDDCRYDETPTSTCSPQRDSLPTSPVSPYRYQRFPSIFNSGPTTTPYPFHGSAASHAATSPQPRQRGSSDSEGRFPSSPSDICHSPDLRRAALMRSVQMRTQPLGPSQFEVSYGPMQEAGHSEERTYREYQIEEVCTSMSISEPEDREKSCRVLDMDLKVDEPAD